LVRYAATNDIEIRENTAVEQIVVENGRVTGVETNGGRIRAETVILAGGAWSSLVKFGQRKLPFDVEPVRGQILEFTTSSRMIRHVIYTPRGYIVPRADGRVLAGSTTEHAGFAKEVTRPALTQLRQIANEISPLLAESEITNSWSG
jgi:glycine oxidase